MANTAAPAAQRTVTVSPQDYQAFLAMLQHEAGQPILRSLNTGNLYDAMGHIASLTDVWLNRAAARGTTPLTQMNSPNQISHWNQDTINQNAASLDPRIRSLFDAYLDHRSGVTQGVNPDVSMYLNRVYMENNPSEGTGWRRWYPQSVQRDAYGDRAGGVQHEFLQLQQDYDVPLQYNVQLNGLRLNPSDYARETFSTYEAEHPAYQNRLGFTPVGGPPARPNDGSNGIEPRASDYGLPTAMSDLRNLWNSVQDGATNLSEGAQGFLRDLFAPPTIGNGPMPTEPPRPGTDGFGTNYGSSKGGSINPGMGVGPGGIGGGLDTLGFNGTINQPGGVSYQPPGTIPELIGPNDFGRGTNVSGGVGNGTVGQLPAGFDPAAYMAANPDLAGPLAAMGMSPAEHYLRSGAAEGRALMPANYTPTQGPSTTAPTLNTGTTVGTQGPTTTATTLPPGFNEQAYLQNNPDLVTALQGTGVSPAQHYLRFGMQEGRTFGPPGLSPTLDTGTTVPTQGPTGLNPLTPYTGMNTPTLTPDTTTPTQGPTGLTPLSPFTGTTVPTIGGGGKDAPTLGPSLTPNIASGTTVPTIGPTTVPTLGPGPTQTATDGTLTPPPTTNLGMTGLGGGITNMPSTSVNTLPPGFNEQAYLQANPDLVQPLAAMGVSPSDHYLRFGMQEGRTIGAPGLTPTLNTGTLAPTLNTATTVGTQGPPGLSPTLDTATNVNTLGPSTTVTASDGPEIAFDPVAYRQANPDIGDMNPFQHFVLAGFNEGRALNPQGQHFGSTTPGFLTFDLPSLTQGLDSGFSQQLMNNFGLSSGGAPGGGIGSPTGWTGANVGGFDVNAPGMGGPVRGFDGGVAYQNNPSIYLPSGAVRTRSSSEAFFRAQQASRDWFDRAARPAAAQNYNVNNQQLAQITPVAPNLTLSNYGMGQMLVGGGLLGAGGTVNHNAGPSFLGGGFGTTWL